MAEMRLKVGDKKKAVYENTSVPDPRGAKAAKVICKNCYNWSRCRDRSNSGLRIVPVQRGMEARVRVPR